MKGTLADADTAVAVDAETPSADRSAIWTWLPIALPALLMIGVGLPGIGVRQLWRDELSTLDMASVSLPELLSRARLTDMVNAPYYAVMHFWTLVWGTSEAALRLPALLGFAATASLTVLIGRRLFNTTVGLTAGLIFAVLPAVVRYSQEARAFGLATASATLAFLLLLRAVERPTWWRWLLYGASIVATGAFHLVALLVLTAHAVYVGIAWARDRDRRLLGWVVTVAAAGLSLLPLIRIAQAQSVQLNWIPPTTFARTVSAVFGYVGSPRVTAVLLGIALLGIWPLGRRSLVLLTWAVGPFLALWLASWYVDLLLNRYMLFTLPALALLAGAAIDRYAATFGAEGRATWQRWALPALVPLLAFALGVGTMAADRRIQASPAEPDLRAAAQLVRSGHQPGDGVGYHGRDAYFSGLAFRYYLPSEITLPTLFTAAGPTVNYTGLCDRQPACAAVTRLWLVNTNDPTDPMAGVSATLRADLERWYVVVRTERVQAGTVTLLARR
jgi:mannosyltransferase